MLLRRIFYRWQVIAAFVLPLWLVVGEAIIGGSAGAALGLLILVPLMGVAMLAVAGLIYARRSVRSSRAVSWPDLGVLAAWHACVIVAAFEGPGASIFGALGFIVALGAFWLAIWELVTETRRRVSAVMETLARTAMPPQVPHTGAAGAQRSATSGSRRPPVIVVEEHRHPS
jgi:hypothetical protein